MADQNHVRFFDPLALAELNRALKWQRRYRRLRKLAGKLQDERRGHLRLIDLLERAVAGYERAAAAAARVSAAPLPPAWRRRRSVTVSLSSTKPM